MVFNRTLAPFTYPRGLGYSAGTSIGPDVWELDNSIGTVRGVFDHPPIPIFRCTNGGALLGLRAVHAAWFGVVADFNEGAGTGTDNQPALQAAINCCAASFDSDGGPQVIMLPPGKIGLGSPLTVAPSNVFTPTIVGAGNITSGTELWTLPSFSGARLLHIASNAGSSSGVAWSVRDLSLHEKTINAGRVGLDIGTPGYDMNPTNLAPISNVQIHGFNTGVRQTGVRRVGMRDTIIDVAAVSNGVGIELATWSGGISGDSTFETTEVQGNSSSIGLWLHSPYAGRGLTGIRILKGVVFYGCGWGVYLDPSGGGNVSDVWIKDAQFDACGIPVWGTIPAGAAGSWITNVHIKDNYLQSTGPDFGHKGIVFSNNGAASSYMRSLFLHGNYVNGVAGRAIELYRVDNATLFANQISDGLAGGDCAISLHTCRTATVVGNTGFSSDGGAKVTDFIRLDGSGSDNLTIDANRGRGYYSGSVVNNATTRGAPDIRIGAAND